MIASNVSFCGFKQKLLWKAERYRENIIQFGRFDSSSGLCPDAVISIETLNHPIVSTTAMHAILQGYEQDPCMLQLRSSPLY
jgi:hypothetical protein